MKNFKQTMRTTSICLITAATIALTLPNVSHAGWGNNTKPAKNLVQKAKAKAAAARAKARARAAAAKARAKAKAKAAAARVKAGATASLRSVQSKVNDMQAKVNTIYAQMENSAPLINVIKDSNLVGELKDIAVYVHSARADYDQFANSGIHVFAQDMTNVLYGFGDMGKTLKLGNGLDGKLDKAHDLLADLPPQFMYILDKAIGPTMVKISEDVQALNEKLAVVANLPSNRDMIRNPQDYTEQLCPLVNDKKTKVTYAIIMGRLKLLAIKLGYANDLIPDEIEVVVNAVAGGGTSVPNPAKAVSKTIKMIADSGIQRLTNAGDIAEVVCE